MNHFLLSFSCYFSSCARASLIHFVDFTSPSMIRMAIFISASMGCHIKRHPFRRRHCGEQRHVHSTRQLTDSTGTNERFLLRLIEKNTATLFKGRSVTLNYAALIPVKTNRFSLGNYDECSSSVQLKFLMLNGLPERRERLKLSLEIHTYFDFQHADLQSRSWHRRCQICHRWIQQ